MKFLLVNDIHATERAPSSCTDSYTDDLFDLLAQTVRMTWEDTDIEAVIWAGDVFHHKAPTRTSHRLVQRMVSVVQGYRCPLWIVPGNHDIQNDRLDSVMSTQPLGVLARSGATLLSGWNPGGYCRVYGVPWLQTWDDEHVTTALRDYVLGRGQYPTLVVTHAPLYPPGQELEFENYPVAKFAKAMQGHGHVHYGHVHERHGVYQAGGVTFCNPGALSRGSLHEHNLTRIPAVVLWDAATGEFREIQLDARPASAVFRLTEHAEAVDAQDRYREFLESVGSATLEVLSVESVSDHVRGLGLPAGEVTLAEELLAWATAEEAGAKR
jgi:DNA repair exonuclease SbcCD nuclease subunit